MGEFKRVFLALIVVLSALGAPLARAQSKQGGATPYDTRNTAGIILISGLVGGVLGLSTLSFYDRPQDHIKNITFGAGVGIIASALFLTAAVATTPPPVTKSGDWNIYPSLGAEESLALNFLMDF